MFYINNIKLNNFKCYENSSFDFLNGINIIIGENAVGKTSIVEAISYALIAKSFRTNRDIDNIMYDRSYFSINCSANLDGINKKIVIYQDNNGKKITINEEKIKRISEILVQHGVVSFTPDDLKIIKGTPLDRRKFLDFCLCQVDKTYIQNLQNYNLLLKERNEYFKQNQNKPLNQDYIDILNNQLIALGGIIINKRKKFFLNINNVAEKMLNIISKNEEKFRVNYLPNTTEETYEKDLKKKQKYDAFMESTSVGPHRDDFEITINYKNAAEYASQGQIRSCVLCLKLAFYDILKKVKTSTIVILDDVLSELDKNRQNMLFEILDDNQIFITSTNLDNINADILEKSNILHIGKE